MAAKRKTAAKKSPAKKRATTKRKVVAKKIAPKRKVAAKRKTTAKKAAPKKRGAKRTTRKTAAHAPAVAHHEAPHVAKKIVVRRRKATK